MLEKMLFPRSRNRGTMDRIKTIKKFYGGYAVIDIRYVQAEDKVFWYSLDQHLPETEFMSKVRDKRGYIIALNRKPIGLFRYNLFWDNIPFCTMLYIDLEHQEKDTGKS